MAKVNPLFWTIQMCIPFMGLVIFDVTAKSLKNIAKTIPTLQNQVGEKLLTLASFLEYFAYFPYIRRG